MIITHDQRDPKMGILDPNMVLFNFINSLMLKWTNASNEVPPGK